eukprot:tig00020780_g13809.t1
MRPPDDGVPADSVEQIDSWFADEEMMEFARHLGIDPETEGHLMHLALEAWEAPVPEPWLEIDDGQGRIYFYNEETDVSQWEHPLDKHYAAMVARMKEEGAAQRVRARRRGSTAWADDSLAPREEVSPPERPAPAHPASFCAGPESFSPSGAWSPLPTSPSVAGWTVESEGSGLAATPCPTLSSASRSSTPSLPSRRASSRCPSPSPVSSLAQRIAALGALDARRSASFAGPSLTFTELALPQ